MDWFPRRPNSPVCVPMGMADPALEADLFIEQAIDGADGQSERTYSRTIDQATRPLCRPSSRSSRMRGPLPRASRPECARDYRTQIRDDGRGGLGVGVSGGLVPLRSAGARSAMQGCSPVHHTRKAAAVRYGPDESVTDCVMNNYHHFTGLTWAGPVLYDASVSAIQ